MEVVPPFANHNTAVPPMNANGKGDLEGMGAPTFDEVQGCMAACYEWADSYDSKASSSPFPSSRSTLVGSKLIVQCIGLGPPRRLHCAHPACRLHILSRKVMASHASR